MSHNNTKETRSLLRSLDLSSDNEEYDLQRQTVDYNGKAAHNGQIQNVKDARVYVFGESDFACNKLDGNPDSTEMRNRGDRNFPNSNLGPDGDIILVKHSIQKDDSLQKISLKYACPVAELKRLNNLISEQDFYALTTIKIPIKRHSVLTELVPPQPSTSAPDQCNVHNQHVTTVQPHSVSYNSYTVNDSDSDTDDPARKLLLKETVIPNNALTQSEHAANYLQKMDADINTLVNSAASREDSVLSVTNSLMSSSSPFVTERPKSMWNPVDCGIHWRGILVCVLLVGIVAPLFYFIFFEYIHPSLPGGT